MIHGRTFSLFLLVALVPPVLIADDAAPAPTNTQPITTANPSISVDQLAIMVTPLSKEELEVESKAWFELLRAKAGEIANAQLKAKNKSGELSKPASSDAGSLSEVDKSLEAAKTGAPAPNTPANGNQPDQDKAAIYGDLAELRTEQTALIDRFNVVLSAYEAKGGDIAAYHQYVDSISGIGLDVTDWSAAWLSIEGWLKSPEGGWRWGRNIVLFLVILIATWIAGRFASGAVSRVIGRAKLSQIAQSFIVNSLRRTVWALGFILALTMLEVNIAPLLAAIGALGFIVGFALQGTLSNFASGLMILLYRPFDTGDVIDAGGVKGKVQEMNLVSTTFLTFDNQKIIVPNNEIWGNVITNVTANATRRVDMVFGIGYDDDIEKATKLLTEIVKNHPLVLSEPEPVIKLNELADSSVNFICRPWANTSDYWDVHWDITKSVKERFDEANISIPYPQRDVHVHQLGIQPRRVEAA